MRDRPLIPVLPLLPLPLPCRRCVACRGSLRVSCGPGIYNTPSLPTCFERFCHILFYAVSDEFVFYYGHRWLHENKWERFRYNKIHKIHHEFTSPIGLTVRSHIRTSLRNSSVQPAMAFAAAWLVLRPLHCA